MLGDKSHPAVGFAPSSRSAITGARGEQDAAGVGSKASRASPVSMGPSYTSTSWPSPWSADACPIPCGKPGGTPHSPRRVGRPYASAQPSSPQQS